MNFLSNHNFNVVGADTDSILFCKQDQSPFSKEEQISLLKEINDMLPEHINFEHDGIFSKVIYLRSKNYILYDGKKIAIKGSSLKSSTLEPIMKEMLDSFIKDIIHNNGENLLDLYLNNIKLVSHVEDIRPYSKKMTLSATTYASKRKNETNLLDAIRGTEYVEGDRVHVYFKSDGTLKLAEHFDGDYDKDRLYYKFFTCAQRFATVMDMSSFLNFKLKRNKSKLLEISYV